MPDGPKADTPPPSVTCNSPLLDPIFDYDRTVGQTIIGGATLPPTTVISFRPGQTRANNAVVALSATGDISVLFEAASGGVHFVLDVNGYFE